MLAAAGLTPDPVPTTTPITLQWASRQQEGSCNSCQDRTNDAVALISMKTVSIKLCTACLRQLLNLIKDERSSLNLTS